MIRRKEVDLGGSTLSIEMGRIAKQADGAALVPGGRHSTVVRLRVRGGPLPSVVAKLRSCGRLDFERTIHEVGQSLQVFAGIANSCVVLLPGPMLLLHFFVGSELPQLYLHCGRPISLLHREPIYGGATAYNMGFIRS